jgi:Family of unknown function (DUF5670)
LILEASFSGDGLEAQMRFGAFLAISLSLLILWACAFLVFHVASALIHLLLLMAVIFFIGHLVRNTSTT